jgi:hypothetical protein
MGGWAGQTRRRLALLGNAGQQRRAAAPAHLKALVKGWDLPHD